MSAPRISKSSVDWAKLAKVAGKQQQQQFNRFKGRSDLYLRRVLENPETPPAIDFNVFKSKVANKKAVEQLESAYKAFSVSYPKDDVSAKIDQQEANAKIEGKKFADKLNGRIKEAEELLEKFKVMIPYDKQTEEDFIRTFPDWSITAEAPTLAPYTDKAIGLSKEKRKELLELEKKSH